MQVFVCLTDETHAPTISCDGDLAEQGDVHDLFSNHDLALEDVQMANDPPPFL